MYTYFSYNYNSHAPTLGFYSVKRFQMKYNIKYNNVYNSA